jgi:hypothetical protein
MLGTALDSFAKAAGVSAWADGLASTLPKGTIEAAAATLSGAFPKISGVIDSVMAERKEAGGDGEKGERPSDRPEQEQAEKVAGAEMAEAPADEAPEPDVGSGEMPDIPGAPEPGSET